MSRCCLVKARPAGREIIKAQGQPPPRLGEHGERLQEEALDSASETGRGVLKRVPFAPREGKEQGERYCPETLEMAHSSAPLEKL